VLNGTQNIESHPLALCIWIQQLTLDGRDNVLFMPDL